MYILRARKRLLSGLAFLLVLLLILTWIGLTRQLHTSIRPGAARAAVLAQVEPPRTGSSLVYDPLQRVVLLFGGTILAPGGVPGNATWAWNGQSWHQLHPATSPPALQGQMVYDAASRQVLLFLTEVLSGGNVADQLWNWNGSTWQQLRPALMPEVIGASLAYDAARGRVLLFGGARPDGHTSTLLNATWTWNGNSWQEQHPMNSPTARTAAALAYDSARQQLVLYGGLTNAGLSSDTWTWNGSSWQQLRTLQSPPLRQDALLVYDNAAQQLLLFGGLNPAGTQPAPADTWTLRANGWNRLSPAGAPTALYESVVYDEATHMVLVYAVQQTPDKLTPVPPVSQTWAWNGSVWKLLL